MQKKGMMMSPADFVKGIVVGLILGAALMYLYSNGMLSGILP